MKNEYDVAIVGAGPSGSIAAKTIAEKNINVTLIERKKEENIGLPVNCAEGINKFLFEDVGIKKDHSFIKQKIDGTKIYFNEEIYHLDSETWKGYTIDRKIFDKYLVRQAKMKGAKLLDNTKVIGINKENKKWILKLRTDGTTREIKAKIVIGADGFECNIGRWAGIRKKWKKHEYAKCLEYEIGDVEVKDPHNFHILFSPKFPDGYGWIFPKGKSRANIGIGIHPEYNTLKSLNYLIDDYRAGDSIIKSLSRGKYSIIEKRGGGVPICGAKNIDEIVTDGLMLVGDAAAIVEPITAEGIEPSMLSGVASGETAVNAILENNWTKKYLINYNNIWKNKKYNGKLLLGEELEKGIKFREEFYKAFTDENILPNVREEIISFIS